ncbi:SCO6745 family protein [Brevibacterium litoralis]|uniref:SCO6745 family protein n=1 Tax=Brevibacterium litoralis TaxID=3138935 RepID=UPI0032F0230B
MNSSRRRDDLRATTHRLELLHSASYFSPRVSGRYAGLGIEHPSAMYFAGRGAPLGAVGGPVLAATFHNFNPDYVAQFLPSVWDTAAPAEVLQARHAGVEDMLVEFFPDTPETAALAATAERLAGQLRPVVEAQCPDGRTLYAATAATYAEAPRASSARLQPFLDLWAVATLLREYRGDGHIGALVGQGLSGLEAVVLHCATGTAFRPRAARKSRGWSDEQWEAATADLVSRGLLAGSGDEVELTADGKDLRARLEAVTDAACEGAWDSLDDPELSRIADEAKAFARLVRDSGVFPGKVFAPGSGRTTD